MLTRNALRLMVTLAVLAAVAVAPLMTAEPTQADRRATAQRLMGEGNFNDAYGHFRALCLAADTDARLVSADLLNAVNCLTRLGRLKEVDELLESTVAVHKDNWRLLHAAAKHYLSLPHFGFLIAGEFERGSHRGGGKQVNSLERDRVRAMQLVEQALPLVRAEEAGREAADFYQSLANMLLYNRGYHEAWRLQYKTDLTTLPDYDEGYPAFQNFSGAPVDEEGEPVFHRAVNQWEDAQTDGERWRWALIQVVESDPSRLNYVRNEQAQFYMNQFGVQTMQQWGYHFPTRDDDTKTGETGTFELHTLAENETICRLATGVRRITLPDEFNHVKIFQQIADEPQTGYGEEALGQLAQIFENRRQYPKAAEVWRKNIERFGEGQRNWKRERLQQIVGNWGQFEPITTLPAGEGATVEYRFRNGKKLALTAQEIDVDKLLADVKAYLKSDPGQLDWEKLNIEDLGYRLVQKNQAQYLGAKVAAWELELAPRENHFDRRITISTPLEKPGAYLLTAAMEGGNVSKIILWVADTAIVRKQLSGKSYYFIADAVAGKPVGGANVEFFGYQQKHLGGRRFQIVTTNFAEKADADGQVIPDPRDLSTEYQWLVIARGEKGRFAYLGFSGVWSGEYYDAEYNAIKAFAITDRPVYRPEQKVHFKFWVRHAQYDMDNVSQFAGQTFPVELYDPRGEKIFSQTLETDEYGGLEGEWEIPREATLGVYRLNLIVQDRTRWLAQGNTTFRVEEYKKPEFEVTVEAPQEPVMLGEKIAATVKAKYYFGSPVTEATVKYKVTRESYSQEWYPWRYWDWFYGGGYWWYAYDYRWYPGWEKWHGCVRPIPWWWPRASSPPEIVAEREMKIGEDGTVEVEIDTAFAKEMYGNTDHRYTITAEVRDASRRTIVGSGQVLVARQPFKVFSWVDRGYYRVGDVMEANFLAQTLDRKPVEGQGVLTLLKIQYRQEEGRVKPLEIPVRRWEIGTDAQGRAAQQMKASAAGMYRLSYKVTDKKGHTIEGGYIFTIIGEGFTGENFEFNDLELIPNQAEYEPGDKVALQVNTNRAGASVLLFIRPANGVYLPPKVLHLDGKSAVEEIEVVRRDMPNFFVEALTVAGGKVFTQVREIVVPPEDRVLEVAVEPDAVEYLPGGEAKVKLQLTELNGEPFQGSTVVSIYDKAVEYISGGSNVGDIREFFWKWRRSHNVNQQTSLARWSSNLTLPGQPAMSFLGVFGATVADELDAMELGDEVAMEGGPGGLKLGGIGGMGGGGFGGALMERRAGMAMEMDGAAMPMAAMAEAAPMADAVAMGADRAGGAPGEAAPGGGDLVEAHVRTEFADTALWVGALTTDKAGQAEVTLKMPENLTAWKINVWAMGHGTRTGSGHTEVVTRKNLILRLQAPRFFVQKDEVVLSANVHNYLATEKQAVVSLEIPGGVLEATDALTRTVTIPAGGQQRVDWRVKVAAEGEAVVRMKALTDEESDAMEMKFPAFVHGMLKQEAWAGTVRPEEDAAKVTVLVPEERRVEQSRLEVRYSPTLAGAMIDALPYLVDYPYGCTEQTLNRFLPTVITQKTLIDMRLDLAAIREKRVNLNAQELGDPAKRAAQWQRFERNPVFDEEEVSRMVKEGVKRLLAMQNGDGGWGWFSGWGERSFPHTTAVVVRGLLVACDNDVAIPPDALSRGVQWLERYQSEQVQLIKNAKDKEKDRRWKERADNLDAMVYLVLVQAGVKNDEMRDFLYRDRIELAVYAKAMLGLALHLQGDRGERLEMVMQNISQFLVQDEENETAYLRLPADNWWWYWYGDEVEANAYYLKLLARMNPQGKEAPRLVKYLLNNRKHATYWKSTRDTALVVEAFADYIRATGEMEPDLVVEVYIDGEKRREVQITRENLFTFEGSFVLEGEEVKAGSREVEIRRRGKGPVYYNVYLTNFTLEDFITKAGLEIKVERKYYKLEPVEKTVHAAGSRGQVLGQRVEKYERRPIANLDELVSGDLVEIELEIESKNDYEYIVFEDMKAAGFEPVEVRSGYAADGLRAYMELRDERVTFFLRQLMRGNHSIAYRMRAEIPGTFSALPARGYAMYAPELKANSDELKVIVVDPQE